MKTPSLYRQSRELGGFRVIQFLAIVEPVNPLPETTSGGMEVNVNDLTEIEYKILVKIAYGIEKWQYYLVSTSGSKGSQRATGYSNSTMNSLFERGLLEMNTEEIYVTMVGRTVLLQEPLRLVLTLLELELIDKAILVTQQFVQKEQLPELLTCNNMSVREAAGKRTAQLGGI